MPIDLEYCERLEEQVNAILERWIEGAEHEDVAFNRGQNYGNIIKLILLERGLENRVVIETGEFAKHCVDLQLQDSGNVGYQSQREREQARCFRVRLRMEHAFWRGIIRALE